MLECRGIMDLDLLGQEDLQLRDRLSNGVEDGLVGSDGHLDVLVLAIVLQELGTVGSTVGALLEGIEVVRGVGVLDMTEQLGSLASEEVAPAQQSAHRAHVARVDVGEQGIAAAQERDDLVGVDTVALGLPAADGLHVASAAEEEGDVLVGTEVCDPVPAEGTLDANNHAVAIGFGKLEEAVGLTGDRAMADVLAVRIEDPDVHIARVQVDSAVALIELHVETYGGCLSEVVVVQPHATCVKWTGSMPGVCTRVVCLADRSGSILSDLPPIRSQKSDAPRAGTRLPVNVSNLPGARPRKLHWVARNQLRPVVVSRSQHCLWRHFTSGIEPPKDHALAFVC